MISVNKILLAFVFVQSLRVFAQDPLKQQFEYSLNLYNTGMYFQTVTEMKRLLCFDTAGTYSYGASLYTGRAYHKGGFFESAIENFSNAIRFAGTKNDIFTANKEIVKSNILRGTYPQALAVLNRMEPEGKVQEDEIRYWRGWVYMFSDEWDMAEEEFRVIGQDHELSGIAHQVVEAQYSVTLAKTMSYILPGAGQFYTGNYLSGLMSLGWNVLWGYLTINAFIEERVFDGIVIANFLWLRFYRGNIQNAEKLAEEKNLEISNKTLNWLQHKYGGEKP